ncbi:MAG TPA: pilus assembly protein [Planctomycetes bacterium]|nr:pilus assembly protein [Planctomycetota bacterium]
MKLGCKKRTKRRLGTMPSRHGATIVEFALVAPIFFILLFGGIEFATLSTIRATSHNAAYEGARKLVIPGADVTVGIAEAERIMSII